MTQKERVEAAKAASIEAQDRYVCTIVEELKKVEMLPLAYMPTLVGVGVGMVVIPDWDSDPSEDENWMLDLIRYDKEANEFEVHAYSIDNEDVDRWETLSGLNFNGGETIDVLNCIQWLDTEVSVEGE